MKTLLRTCKSGLLTKAAILMALGGVAPAVLTLSAESDGYAFAAQETTLPYQPPLVTFGPSASQSEGDHDFKQLIRFSIPASAGRVYVRVFDPDVDGAHDEPLGGFASQTRFSLYGDGSVTSLLRDEDGVVQEIIRGEPLDTIDFGSDPQTDGKWKTLFSVEAGQGIEDAEQREFILAVEGLEGNDGNVFDVAISTDDDKNRAPDQLRLYSFVPTFQSSKLGTVAELRFQLPAEANAIVVENFDAAGGDIEYAGRFRSLPLDASGKSEWQSNVIELEPQEVGRGGSITAAGGRESPNDLTVFVGISDATRDATEQPVAIDLPIRVSATSKRPVVAYQIEQLSCTQMRFDASASSDPEGGDLSYQWRFDNDIGWVPGADITQEYTRYGSHNGRLEVFDKSGLIANGSAVDFSFDVKPPPVSRFTVPPLVAQDFAVSFDGTASATRALPPTNRIVRYHWRFGDGSELVQVEGDINFGRPEHTYEKHGTFEASLTVYDSAGNPCNAATSSRSLTVNAPPVANAGDDLRIGLADAARFDAGALLGVDGDNHTFSWTFGDGQTGAGSVVSHLYEKPGTYTVTLTVDDQKNATNSIATDQAVVLVNAAPDGALVQIPQQILIGRPEVFDASGFRDPDGQIQSVRWRFGDGTSSDKAAVRHAFFEEGPVEVSVTATDDSGLSNASTTIKRTVQIVEPPNQPPIAIAGDEREATVGQVLSFDASQSSDPDGSILAYLWDFSDGTTANTVKVEHVYRTPGTYRVSLQLRDDSGKPNNLSSTSFDVIVSYPQNSSPRISVGGDRAAFVNEILQFDATGTSDDDGNVTAIQWDFGDGSRASGYKATHSYAKPGTYQVNVLVNDDSGRRGAQSASQFEVSVTHGPNQKPTIDLIGELTLEAEQIYDFDARAAGDPDGHIISYEWIFGDGDRSDRPLVEHAYRQPGTYTAKLILTDDSTLQSGVHTHEMEVLVVPRPNVPPVADAGADIETIVGETITLDASGSSDEDGSLIAYDWTFGDERKVRGQKPAITYFVPGQYEVALTVTDNSGQDNATATDVLTVTVRDKPNQPPVAAVKPNIAAAIEEIITFSAAASDDPDGNIIAYEWDFGDGTRAQGRETTHRYDRSGTYVARLTIRDDSRLDSDQASAERTIVINQPPIANAGINKDLTASRVIFDASNSFDFDGDVAGYEWDFGDGTKGTGSRIAHVYQRPGTYRAKLSIRDNSGTIRNEAADEILVHINALPIADAGFDRVAAPGETVAFDASRSSDPDGTIARYHWNFRDGNALEGERVEHAFTEPGLYAVELRVHDDSGHSNAVDFSHVRVVVNSPPQASAGPDLLVAPDEKFTLSGVQSIDPDGTISNWRWDIQSTDETLDGEIVQHSFAEPGIYAITLTVTDDSIAANRTAQDEVIVKVNSAPVAEAGSDLESASLRVTLDAGASADADSDGLTYTWDLGDGNVVHGTIVEHTYETGGVYPVLLTADDGTGLSNARDTDSMTVRLNRAPLAVAGENKQACVGDVFVFDASSSLDPDNGLLRYEWTFGDGEKSDIINPTKTYANPGTYRVGLSVRDESGLANATHKDDLLVSVLPAPVAHAGADVEICAGSTVQFDGTQSSDVDGVVNRFSWDFGDGQSGGGDRPEHTYIDAGLYRVTLQVEGDNLGICSPISTDDLLVKVLDAPTAVIEAPSAVAVGQAVDFNGLKSTIRDGSIAEHEWDFGDGNTDFGASVTHVFTQPGVYKVQLQARSGDEASGCASTSAVHLVTVNAAPNAKIITASAVEVNRSLVLSGALSSDPDGGIADYNWDFGDGGHANGVEVSHIWREPGNYKVTLTVNDGGGLENSTQSHAVDIQVVPAPHTQIRTAANACPAQPVTFDLHPVPSDLDPATLRWSFGDGTMGEGKSVTHTFKRAGTYSVTATAPLERAGRTIVSPFSRNLIVNEAPVAILDAARKACAGAGVTFDASRSFDPDGTIQKYFWDFGDGNTAQGMQATHHYAEPGTYTPVLTVTDASGSACASTARSGSVFVNAPPVANAGPDIVSFAGGAHDSIVLDAGRSVDRDGDTLEYYWTLSNGVEIDGEKGRVEFANAGTVTAELIASDLHGLECSIATDIITIRTRARKPATPLTEE